MILNSKPETIKCRTTFGIGKWHSRPSLPTPRGRRCCDGLYNFLKVVAISGTDGRLLYVLQPTEAVISV